MGKNIAAIEEFKKAFGSREVFFQFLDMFPYMVEIFAIDGTSVFINRAGCEEGNVADPDEVTGNYNILNDPVVMDVLGLREIVLKAFNGETVIVNEVRVPFEDLEARYKPKKEKHHEVKFQKVTGFPIHDEKQKLTYIVMIFETLQTFKGRKEITRAEEYMEKNWYDDFDLEKIAKTADLSPFHFSRLFKQKTGMTPHNFYKNVKIGKLKEKLCDPNMSVSEAFTACNIDYKGRYLQNFREATGMSPSQYKKDMFKTQKK